MQKITDAIKSRRVSNGDGTEEEPDPLTCEELKLLLDKVQEHYLDHYPLFLFLARTGCRIGEALGLKWGDIDFNGRFIDLKRSLSRGRITTLKNKRERIHQNSPWIFIFTGCPERKNLKLMDWMTRNIRRLRKPKTRGKKLQRHNMNQKNFAPKCTPSAPGALVTIKKGSAKCAKPLNSNGGSDETRTRDLRRDRPAF